MRTVPAVVILVGAMLLVRPAMAGPDAPAPLPSLPLPTGRTVSNPIPVPQADAPGLPDGTDFSRPLQPVGPPPPSLDSEPSTQAPIARTIIEDRNPRPGKVLGQFWDTDELLIWWAKAQPLPPLVTGSRTGIPVLGQPQTSLIVGNRAIDNQDIAGYRLNIGYSLNDEDTIGFEGKYFFLGTRTLTASVSDLTSDRFRSIGLPYINSQTGQEAVLVVASPGQSSDLVQVSTTTRMQGAEANLVANLYADTGVKIHAIAGYRFLQLNEGLRIAQSYLQDPTALTPTTVGLIADQFDARNAFNGGQLGFMADLNHGAFYVELSGKAAIGINSQVVVTDGVSHFITAANPVPILQSYAGGVYAQPTSMGQAKQSVFAVVPEGTFKVGLKYGDRGRIYAGYNFLYLSDAVRPGDQVSRTINPSQIPLLNPGGTLTGLDRPLASFNRTDFWAQGLIIGFEYRF